MNDGVIQDDVQEVLYPHLNGVAMTECELVHFVDDFEFFPNRFLRFIRKVSVFFK